MRKRIRLFFCAIFGFGTVYSLPASAAKFSGVSAIGVANFSFPAVDSLGTSVSPNSGPSLGGGFLGELSFSRNFFLEAGPFWNTRSYQVPGKLFVTERRLLLPILARYNFISVFHFN